VPAPIEGGVDECEVEFAHHMQVTRIYESPRVTLPYTDEQWADVMALGAKVDEELVAGDVRLTMGGEPTFVAVNDRDAAEWNTDALGPTKRGLASELVHKLRDEYGQGGFLHFGQGKWYPGEQLPRWALSICWRADGQPIWNDPSLFADEREAAHLHRRGFAAVHPGPVAQARPERPLHRARLRRHLVLPVARAPPAGQRGPVRIPKLEDEMERIRLRRVFTQGLDTVVGYVLPLQCNPPVGPGLAGPLWTTGPWFFRDERMYLFPGDSPMGYRLPLDSLPWVSEADYPYLIEQDPYAVRDALPQATTLRAQYNTVQAGPDATSGLRGPRPRRRLCRRRRGGGAGAGPRQPARASPVPRRPIGVARSSLRMPTSAPTRRAHPSARSRRTGSPAPRCAWRCETRCAPTDPRPRPSTAARAV
jgi:uncharacterized protein (DUF2126 family)